MESKQRLIIVKAERLQELQADPSRTGNIVDQVGAIDICCRCLHPISPNKQVRGFSSRFQHRMHRGGHNIDGS